MSGGAYDYDQYKILHIAEEIESIIENNNSDKVDEYGDRIGRNYSEETIAEFKTAVELLNKAFIYAHRIDWLLECDDDEATFHKRLKQELEKL